MAWVEVGVGARDIGKDRKEDMLRLQEQNIYERSSVRLQWEGDKR